MNITSLSLIETIKALEEKQFSEEELNNAYLEKINILNPKLNIFLEVKKNTSGIPAGIKDVFCTKDLKTTAASKILSNFIPPYNATVINRLSENRVSVIGKTNCDEFAQGGSGENSAYGPTKNPWDVSKVPGGSSSGSAAAVASDCCVFALGSDTGGSIRQPASFCGVVGLKTTYGRVSRYGLIPMASSLDTVGPITKSVEDASLVLDWISGKDNFDSNCKEEKFSFNFEKLQSGVKGLKIGVPKEYFGKGLDSKVKQVIESAIKKIEELGAEVVDISLPHSQYSLAAYYIIVPSEVSSNMAKFDGIRFGLGRENFGEEVKRRIMLGSYALSAGYWDEYYSKAAKVRTLIKQDFDKAFHPSTHSINTQAFGSEAQARRGRNEQSRSTTGSGCDVIVGPVSPTTAWNLGEKIDDPLTMYLADIYTVAANLAGIPGLSVPCGFVDGLPVGLQILGKHFDEETILKVGFAYQQATDWRKEKPQI